MSAEEVRAVINQAIEHLGSAMSDAETSSGKQTDIGERLSKVEVTLPQMIQGLAAIFGEQALAHDAQGALMRAMMSSGAAKGALVHSGGMAVGIVSTALEQAAQLAGRTEDHVDTAASFTHAVYLKTIEVANALSNAFESVQEAQRLLATVDHETTEAKATGARARELAEDAAGRL